MGRRKLSDNEIKARGSTLASTRKAEAKRAREFAALTPKRGVVKREEAARAPLPATEAEWVDLVKSLPGYDPARLAGGCLFDPALASKAIDWIETNVRHMKGPKALSAFHLERWQRAFVANLFGWIRPDGTRRFREALLYVGKKNGKALDEDTPIPTPSGWTRMGDVVAGDAVFDEHGKPCRVVAVGPTQHDRPCYRVTFDDGTSIVADAEHEWYTDAYRTGRLPRHSRKGISREDTKQKPADHIRTTQQIRDTLRFSCGGPAVTAANHSIPIAAPLRLRQSALPIEPYTLGAWLGDGSSATAQITCAMVDYQIIEEINRDGYESGVPKFYKPRSTKTATVTLTPGVHGKRGTSRLRNALRALGVLGNKRIPACYLRASEAQRMALLQGLMDTDGYVSKAGDCNFDNTSEALIRGVEELARSLGFKPRTQERRASVNGKDCGPSWRIQFKAFSDRPCFRLARKAARLRPPPSYRARSMRRQIVSVEPVPSVPVRCIQVDSPSRLYLAGPGMVPTHNSLLVAALALYLFLEDGEAGAEVYCAAAKRDQAKIVWNDCVTQLKRIDPDEAKATRYQHSVTAPDGGFLKPISADAGTEDGMNPHAAMVDELHRQQDDTLLNVIRLSTAARAQPLVIMLTTADEDRPDSVCNETLERAKAVRDNPGDHLKPGYDAEFLPAIYEAGAKEDWKDPAVWRKANPNLGVSLQEEFLAKRCREAQENPAMLPDFLRYHLNVQTRAGGRKLIPDMGQWDACREPFDVETLRGRPCIAGLDLASTTDIVAFVLVFPETLHVLPYFWVPEEAAKRRDMRNDRIYTTWGRGAPTYLTLTEGNQIDEQRILRELVDICRPFKVGEIAVDPYNAVRYTQALTGIGFKVVHVRQGWGTLSEPAKYLTTLVGGAAVPGRPRIRHNGHPVLRWMVSNAELDVDKKENWSLIKPRGAAKIDGVAALVTALSRVIVAPAPKPKGVGSFFIT